MNPEKGHMATLVGHPLQADALTDTLPQEEEDPEGVTGFTQQERTATLCLLLLLLLLDAKQLFQK
jgi:hypothetical protein